MAGLPRAVWAVLAGDAISAIGTGMTLPFLIVYLHDVRGFTLTVAGLAVSTAAVASLVGNPVGGALADRYGPRATLVGALVLGAAGALALIGVRNPWEAFVATATVGLGASIAWPAQDALLATLVGSDQRSTVFSLRHATLNAGLGLGALASAMIVDTSDAHSFVLLYVVDAATFLAFIPVLLALNLPRRDRTDVPADGSALRVVLRDRLFLGVWALCALVVAVGYGQLHSGFPAYATLPGHITASALGIAFAANAITVVVAQLFVLRALRGRRRTTAIGLACATWALAWVVTLAAGQLGAGIDARFTFAAALTIFAIAETLVAPTFAAIVNDIAPDHLRGRYNGMSTLAWTTGFLTGPALAGAMLDAGLGDELFIALIAACALAAAGAGRLALRLPAAANVI